MVVRTDLKAHFGRIIVDLFNSLKHLVILPLFSLTLFSLPLFCPFFRSGLGRGRSLAQQQLRLTVQVQRLTGRVKAS